MACPESTQFFQFDNQGNMYVYAPGAGCSGDAKLEAPGDELIFSNTSQWEANIMNIMIMKQRVAAGIGISLKQAEVLSVTDEDYLWSLGYLGTSNPEQLLHTVVFSIGKGFALRASKEH